MTDSYEGLIEAYKYGQRGLIKLKDKKYETYKFEKFIFTLYSGFEARAWYNCLLMQDVNAAKQDFYNCGLADIEATKKSKDIFGHKRDSPIYAALSDSKDLIRSFEGLEYTLGSGPYAGKTNKELAKIGKGHIYIDTIIKAMNRDEEGLGANLDIMENVTLKLKKHAALKVDYDFFKGILERDKDAIFTAINTLSTKDHKKRNSQSRYMKDIISQPAIGYAKIAWINEFELEFDSPRIFNDLLPVRPLKNYKNEIQPYKDMILG